MHIEQQKRTHALLSCALSIPAHCYALCILRLEAERLCHFLQQLLHTSKANREQSKKQRLSQNTQSTHTKHTQHTHRSRTMPVVTSCCTVYRSPVSSTTFSCVWLGMMVRAGCARLDKVGLGGGEVRNKRRVPTKSTTTEQNAVFLLFLFSLLAWTVLQQGALRKLCQHLLSKWIILFIASCQLCAGAVSTKSTALPEKEGFQKKKPNNNNNNNKTPQKKNASLSLAVSLTHSLPLLL